MKKTGKKINKLPFILIFALGFLIAIYPVISNFYYRVNANNEIANFTKGKNELDQKEIDRRIELARAYNESLDPSRLQDPFTQRQKEGIKEYARMLQIKEMIGHVQIDKIGVNLPIYAGTTEEVLQKGAGHLEGTSLPVGGESTHTVITAHKGLPKALMFRHLDELKEGDVFYIHNIDTVLAYQVDNIVTVEPDNFEHVLVVEGKDYATLLTCTPYMINSHRLLVRGHRIPYTPPVEEDSLLSPGANMKYKLLLLLALLVIIILLIISYSYHKKIKGQEKNIKSK
ncbi:MAG: class C sortase [Finegoldia sp.]|nr:class C sortase [Finegoldia sp.]